MSNFKYNPFHSSPPTTGSAFSAPSGPPPATAYSDDDTDSKHPVPPEKHDLPDIPEEGPPPYAHRPSASTREMNVEQGSARSFQDPSPRPANNNNDYTTNRSGPAPSGGFSMPVFGSRRRGGGGIIHQLVNSVLNPQSNSTNSGGGSRHWSESLLGQPSQPQQQQQQQQQYYPPPQSKLQSETYRSPPGPPPPSNNNYDPSRSGLEAPPRDPNYAGDFYPPPAEEGPYENETRSGPSGPWPAQMGNVGVGAYQSNSQGYYNINDSLQDDGRPTSYPAVGHPLLLDGELLVYPIGYECDKCHNIGYEDAETDKPCKKCWRRYATYFSGPLAYSFSSSSTTANFQRPLPYQSGHKGRRQRSRSRDRRRDGFIPNPLPPQAAGSRNGGIEFGRGIQNRLDRHLNHLNNRFDRLGLSSNSGPASGAAAYSPGGPRVGGVLCWKCDGRGSMMDRTMCPVCGGSGRTFG